MSNKNKTQKKTTSERKAQMAKAGKRAGSPKVNAEQVHKGKLNWIIDQVWTKETMLIADACAQVKANKATEEMARQIIRTNLANLNAARTIEHKHTLEGATMKAKQLMASWS